MTLPDQATGPCEHCGCDAFYCAGQVRRAVETRANAVSVRVEAENVRLREELRIARWDADVPIRELREEVDRLVHLLRASRKFAAEENYVWLMDGIDNEIGAPDVALDEGTR